jgi:hypothetical protein
MHFAIIFDINIVFIHIIQTLLIGGACQVQLPSRWAHDQVDLVLIHVIDCFFVMHAFDFSLVVWVHEVSGYCRLFDMVLCYLQPLTLEVLKK